MGTYNKHTHTLRLQLQDLWQQQRGMDWAPTMLAVAVQAMTQQQRLRTRTTSTTMVEAGVALTIC